MASNYNQEFPVSRLGWVGNTSAKNVLSVLVISTDDNLVDIICQALMDKHSKEKYSWKLLLLRSVDLNHIIQAHKTGNVSIDFVVFGLDTSTYTGCLDWAKQQYAQLHPDLKIRRVVFVNTTGIPPNCMAIDPGELITMCSDLNVELLTSDVYNNNEALDLAERLLMYIEVSIGVKTGIPNLNV